MKALDLRLAVRPSLGKLFEQKSSAGAELFKAQLGRFRLGRWVAQPLSTPTYVATNQAQRQQAVSNTCRKLFV